MFHEIWLNSRMRSSAKVCKSCRSRRELSNEYLLFSIHCLLANFGVDTAENGSLKVCQKLAKRWKKRKLEKTGDQYVPCRVRRDSPGVHGYRLQVLRQSQRGEHACGASGTGRRLGSRARQHREDGTQLRFF